MKKRLILNKIKLFALTAVITLLPTQTALAEVAMRSTESPRVGRFLEKNPAITLPNRAPNMVEAFLPIIATPTIAEPIIYEYETLQPITYYNSYAYYDQELPIIYDNIAIESALSEEVYAPVTNNVQLLNWSEVRNIMPQNTPLQVLDVRTGTIYYIQSFSHGSHADVTPVSASDTEIMFNTFGRRWSWEVRPVIISFNGLQIAASINGQPHGGAGRVGVNNMHGHVCLHFSGSNVHNGNASFARLHQDVVMEAYNWASF